MVFDMNVLSKERHFFQWLPVVLVSVVLLFYSLLFISKWSRPDMIFVGDTLCSFTLYSYQYSGIARGEYPMWNPLVRAGESEEVAHGLHSANPLSNIVVIISVLSGVQDIVLSFAIYILILDLLYAIGVYLLMSCWTGNRYAGVLASILAIGSSSVFFNPFHTSFIKILFAIPWMLYAATMYFRNFKFRYLVVFALAYNLALYSYEVVMGLSYIIMLSVSALIFYHKQIAANISKLKKIPVWHVLALAGILLVVTIPNILMYISFKDKIALSRMTDISITNNYTIKYQSVFSRVLSFQFLSLNFWLSLFTGMIKVNCGELRHYVGPMAVPFMAIALLSLRRPAWCVAISGLLVSMLAGNIFPANLLYEVPVFASIRNGHFFLQYLVFAIIIVAGFGFDYVIRRESIKPFEVVCAFMIFTSLIILFFRYSPLTHNNASLMIVISSMVVVLLAIHYLPMTWVAGTFLIVASAVMFGGTFLANQTPMAGAINITPELMALRHRSNHSLHFRFERPLNIDTISNVPDKINTSFGMDEFVSYVTLKDNSFKTLGWVYGFSSFPLTKSYYLFSSLPGHEDFMKKKFFFFSKCYTSGQHSDMVAFMHDPGLLQRMLEGGVGMVDQVNSSEVSLGPFSSRASRSIPAVAEKGPLEVDVRKYNANSILLNVFVDKRGVLAYSDLWDKGWRVKVDGGDANLVKVFHTFKGVELSPGRHEIEFLYNSKVIVAIIVMNITFWVCVFGLFLYLLTERWHERLAVKWRLRNNGVSSS
ncbi:MAG: YfhO family protein [Desulfobaccales bacterium]